MTVQGYLGELEAIGKALDEGKLSDARRRARALLNRRIRYGKGWISPDRAVLAPLARKSDTGRARARRAKLGVLMEALRSEGASAGSGAAPDVALLEQLRKEEELAEIEKDGRAPAPFAKENRFTKWLAERLMVLGDRVAEIWDKLLDWLDGFFPGKRAPLLSGPGGTKLMVAVVVVVAALTLFLVAYHVLRSRGQRGPWSLASSGPARSSRDEDAFSRSAAEWERYAAELAAGGRAREAIRAWYHAVLVQLYRGGMLHYRKGRTNWEYAYSLSPGLPWRRQFLELTRRFEREWYGRESSAPNEVRACAESAGRILDAVRGR